MKSIKLKSLVVSLVFILLVSITGCAIPYIDITPPASETPAPAPAPASPPINPVWTPPPQAASQNLALPALADVVALVKPSVVAISTEVVTLDFFNRPFTQEGAGSGWIIDGNGIIVTNNHVVEGARNITVTLDDGTTFTADPGNVFTDSFNDLAVIKIDAQNLPALKVGDSSKMRVGDWVIAIGNALGQGLRATEGIVSRQNVSLPVDLGQTLYNLIETSAAINPGNSGGPLVNLAGEVIGITSAKIANIGVEGMGYAISTETAIPIIEALVKTGYVVRPWLGVELRDVDPFVVLRFNLAVDQGALITQVVSGSPAANGGLAAGDVIVSADDKEVSSGQDMIRAIRSSEIGQAMKIDFYRGKNLSIIEVVLVEVPPP